MREILFRGKAVKGDEWIYGTGVITERHNTYDTNKKHIINSVNYDELDYFLPSYDEEEVIPDTISQYTGLKDKNGVRVFEGDIVQSEYCDFQGNIINTNFVVEDKIGNYYFVAVEDPTCNLTMCMCNIDYVVKVIGNKWDNPELMEE